MNEQDILTSLLGLQGELTGGQEPRRRLAQMPPNRESHKPANKPVTKTLRGVSSIERSKRRPEPA